MSEVSNETEHKEFRPTFLETNEAQVYDSKVKPDGTVVLCFVSPRRHYITYFNQGEGWKAVVPSSFEVSMHILDDVAKKLREKGPEFVQDAQYRLA